MTDTTTTHTFLCRLDELQDPDSRGMAVTFDGQLQDIFIVHQGGQVFAYRNSCPHTGGPLDWIPDQFLNLDKDSIQCSTHAARFRISDGKCVAGPCKGDYLTAVPVGVEAGEIVLLAAVSDPNGQ